MPKPPRPFTPPPPPPPVPAREGRSIWIREDAYKAARVSAAVHGGTIADFVSDLILAKASADKQVAHALGDLVGSPD